MKQIIYLLNIVFLFLIIGCSSGNDEVRNQARQALPERDANVVNPAVPQATPAASATAASTGVKHYVCPSNCAGQGGDAAAPCPNCGETFVHNPAFHNTPGATTPTIQQPAGGNAATITPPPPKTPEPAQNAAGVWHYTCPSGCAGGAGSAQACSGCGTTLAHNTTYHN